MTLSVELGAAGAKKEPTPISTKTPLFFPEAERGICFTAAHFNESFPGEGKSRSKRLNLEGLEDSPTAMNFISKWVGEPD